MNNSPSLVRSRSGARKNGGLLPLDRFDNTTVAESKDDDGYSTFRVTLHGTCIAIVATRTERIQIDNGGYDTPTTARRINETLEAFDVPFRVSRAGGWHVIRGGEKVAEFSRRATLCAAKGLARGDA